ncbi:MAG: hypothetical protein IPJ34_06165 [Myxococcales bacterium]|nr:hypothetical protein [Myxococcales bacterium]
MTSFVEQPVGHMVHAGRAAPVVPRRDRVAHAAVAAPDDLVAPGPSPSGPPLRIAPLCRDGSERTAATRTVGREGDLTGALGSVGHELREHPDPDVVGEGLERARRHPRVVGWDEIVGREAELLDRDRHEFVERDLAVLVAVVVGPRERLEVELGLRGVEVGAERRFGVEMEIEGERRPGERGEARPCADRPRAVLQLHPPRPPGEREGLGDAGLVGLALHPHGGAGGFGVERVDPGRADEGLVRLGHVDPEERIAVRIGQPPPREARAEGVAEADLLRLDHAPVEDASIPRVGVLVAAVPRERRVAERDEVLVERQRPAVGGDEALVDRGAADEAHEHLARRRARVDGQT